MPSPLRTRDCRARLFQTGGSQAVRLPKQFRLPGSEVRVRRMGDAVVLEPIREEWSDEFTRFVLSPPEPLLTRQQPRKHERTSVDL